MAVLNTLTFIKYSVPSNTDPVTKRRNKLLEKIDEQILLAKDDTYTPTKRVRTTDADGNTRTVDKPKRVTHCLESEVMTQRNCTRGAERMKRQDAATAAAAEVRRAPSVVILPSSRP